MVPGGRGFGLRVSHAGGPRLQPQPLPVVRGTHQPDPRAGTGGPDVIGRQHILGRGGPAGGLRVEQPARAVAVCRHGQRRGDARAGRPAEHGGVQRHDLRRRVRRRNHRRDPAQVRQHHGLHQRGRRAGEPPVRLRLVRRTAPRSRHHQEHRPAPRVAARVRARPGSAAPRRRGPERQRRDELGHQRHRLADQRRHHRDHGHLRRSRVPKGEHQGLRLRRGKRARPDLRHHAQGQRQRAPQGD